MSDKLFQFYDNKIINTAYLILIGFISIASFYIIIKAIIIGVGIWILSDPIAITLFIAMIVGAIPTLIKEFKEEVGLYKESDKGINPNDKLKSIRTLKGYAKHLKGSQQKEFLEDLNRKERGMIRYLKRKGEPR